MLGSLKRGPHLAGSRYGPGGLTVPNITPDTETGIGSWSEVDLAFFLRTGFTPYGDDVQGEMREAIDDGLRHLTQDDLEAMAAYLKALPAIRNPVSTAPSPPPRSHRAATGERYRTNRACCRASADSCIVAPPMFARRIQ